MDVIVSVIAFIGTLVLIGSAIFIFVSNIKTKKMQKVNHGLDVYVKKKKYLLMKNGGENPCETSKTFGMPLFSQEGNYIVRRKIL